MGKELGVALALPERRQPETQHQQPVVEIASEPAVLDGALEIHTRRGNDPAVDPHRLLTADPTELPVFQRSKQFGLKRKGQLADLVQEQRAAVGLLEESPVGLLRAGERAARMAEELALEEGLGDPGTVDRDERPAPARRGDVDRAREDSFSRA